MFRVAKYIAVAAMAIVILSSSCGGGNSATTSQPDTDTGLIPDTLRVATLYSPTSYFIFRDEEMGYDYSLVRSFAESKGVTLDLEVVPALSRAVEMLDSGLVDVIAYQVPVTAYYRDMVYPCGPETYSSQVLVQRIDDPNPVRDVTDLVGREVWVERNSKYMHRLENLNDELGGGISIKIIDRDTIMNEDLIEMVSNKDIPLTIVDNATARLNRGYYTDIDASLEVSFHQKSRWGVAPDRAWLGDSITAWFEAEGTRLENATLLKRYFELSKATPARPSIDLKKGHISPYDDFFRKYAKEIGWDWRLIASQGWIESQFRSDLVSWAGARGIMQIMPSTARANGIDPASLDDPETSIRLAVRILSSLDKTMSRYITDPTERRKFVVAAYNSGGAHIIDAIALAKKFGRNSNQWYHGVDSALMMKSDERYFNDPVVKYGYFSGRQTTTYVRDVFNFYEKTLKHIRP